jgi:metal-dependent amidase/aminoacylase/carboxypeptidase family protein
MTITTPEPVEVDRSLLADAGALLEKTVELRRRIHAHPEDPVRAGGDPPGTMPASADEPGSMAFLGAAPAGVARPAPNHSNRMIIAEDAMATGIALHAAMALG